MSANNYEYSDDPMKLDDNILNFQRGYIGEIEIKSGLLKVFPTATVDQLREYIRLVIFFRGAVHGRMQRGIDSGMMLKALRALLKRLSFEYVIADWKWVREHGEELGALLDEMEGFDHTIYSVYRLAGFNSCFAFKRKITEQQKLIAQAIKREKLGKAIKDGVKVDSNVINEDRMNGGGGTDGGYTWVGDKE